jgi:hypothetical protein
MGAELKFQVQGMNCLMKSTQIHEDRKISGAFLEHEGLGIT